MSKSPSGFRSKKDDVTGQSTTFPIFDSVGRPLRSSHYIDDSRQQMHALRMQKYDQPQVSALAKRRADGIWINPNIPESVDGIKVRDRVLAYELQYWKFRDQGCSESKARLRASRLEHSGLTKEQIAKYDAVLDTVSAKTVSTFYATPTQYARSSDGILVKHPERNVVLKLKLVNLDDVHAGEKRFDVEKRSQYFYNMYKSGKTVPPILVHQESDGSYRIMDGHARFHALKRLYRETGTLPYAPVVENADQPIKSRPVASKSGYEQWKDKDITSRWAASLPESTKKKKEPVIPVVENLSLGDIGRGIKKVITAPTHLHIRRLPKEGVETTGKYIPPPPGRIEHIKRLREVAAGIKKVQEKGKGFGKWAETGPVANAYWRHMRRSVQSPDPKVRNRAMRTIAEHYPEKLAEMQALEAHRKR